MSTSLALTNLLEKLPSLRFLIDESGNINIHDYASQNYSSFQNNTPLFHERKIELLDSLNTYVSRKFGAELGQKVCDSLEHSYCVSTAEHHGPMGHPFFFQSTLLRWLVNHEDAIINFCTSHVSLGNSSYPRWIVFHGNQLTNQRTTYLHLPFFPANERMSPVFRLPSYTIESRTRINSKIEKYKNTGLINLEISSDIMSFVDKTVFHEEILSLKNYSEQITLLNKSWWDQLLCDMPPYIPLDAEDIICELLENHLHTNTLLARIMTDISLQALIEQYFNGISCCFDLANKTGTYLFWYLDENHVRHALWRNGEELVSVDKSFRMHLEHEELLFHISHRHLIPSGLLVYVTFACYYGLTCFGGFAQGNYLPKIQKAYDELVKILWMAEENLSTQTSLLNEDMIFLYEKNHCITTALDLMIQWRPDMKKMSENAKNTTLTTSITAMIPEIERCLSN